MRIWAFVGLCAVSLSLFAFLLLRWRQAPVLPASQTVSVERAATSSPVPTEHRAPLSVEAFRALGSEVLRALPSRAQVANDSTQPPAFAVAAGAAQIDRLLSAIRNTPALDAEALSVMQACAGSETSLDSVRALCFASYRALSLRLKRTVRESLAPKSVRDLASRLEE